MQRPGIALLEKGLHRRVQGITLGGLLVHPIFNDLGRGVISKKIINRSGQFQRALIAVAADTFDPFGVHHPAAEDPLRFLLQASYLGPLQQLYLEIDGELEGREG